MDALKQNPNKNMKFQSQNMFRNNLQKFKAILAYGTGVVRNVTLRKTEREGE